MSSNDFEISGEYGIGKYLKAMGETVEHFNSGDHPGLNAACTVFLVDGTRLPIEGEEENESVWVKGYMPYGVLLELCTDDGDADFVPHSKVFVPYSRISSIKEMVHGVNRSS